MTTYPVLDLQVHDIDAAVLDAPAPCQLVELAAERAVARINGVLPRPVTPPSSPSRGPPAGQWFRRDPAGLDAVE